MTDTDGDTSIHLYPCIVHECGGSSRRALPPSPTSTLSEVHVNIDALCHTIHDATSGGKGGDERRSRLVKKIGTKTGWGVDEKKIISSLGPASGEERYVASMRYKELFKEDMHETFERNLSGDFCDALVLLSMSPPESECRILNKACTGGLGVDETMLYSVLCGRSNADMEVLKKTYWRLYERDLGKLLVKELSGDFEHLIFTSLQGTEETYNAAHTKDTAQIYADALFERAQKKEWFRTTSRGEQSFYAMMCAAPPPFLIQVDALYKQKYGHGLFYEIYRSKGMSPTCKRAALFTLGMKSEPGRTVSKLIKAACAGMGTDEGLLTACIVRYQPILKEVGLAHLELYDRSIHDRIRGETSFSYRAVLLAVVEAAFPDEIEDGGSGLRASLGLRGSGRGGVMPARRKS